MSYEKDMRVQSSVFFSLNASEAADLFDWSVSLSFDLVAHMAIPVEHDHFGESATKSIQCAIVILRMDGM